MQKFKNLINPGNSKDEEVLYGDHNAGKLAGEGSHFGGTDKPLASSTSSNQNTSGDVAMAAAAAAPAAASADIASATGENSSATQHSQDSALATGAAGTALGNAGQHHSTTGGEGPLTQNPPLSREEQEIQNATFTYRSYPLATGSARHGSAPLMPGRFPSTDGSEAQPQSGITSAGASGSATAPTTGAQIGQPAPTTEHHYGRDATLLGGTAAAGTAAEEHSRHHHHHNNESAAADPDTAVSSATGQNQAASAPSTAHTTEHHLGRDAALEGGAGAAAYGLGKEHEHQGTNNQGLTEQGRPAETASAATQSQQSGFFSGPQGTATSHQPATTSSTYVDQRATPIAPHKEGLNDAAVGGVAGNLGHGSFDSPAGQQTSGLVSGTSQTSPSDQTQHHHGRDAALAGGTAAIGASAYEHEHRKLDNTNPGQSTHGTSQPVGVVSSAEPVSAAHQHHDQHHLGRDAALVGGGAAALGAGAYAHDHQRQEQPTGTGHTSGVASQDESHTPITGQPRLWSSSAGIWQPETSQHTAGTAVSQPSAEQSLQQSGHHHGRDAAVIGGGAAAAGAGAYALDHHEKDRALAPEAGNTQTGVSSGSAQPMSGTTADPFATSTTSQTAAPTAEQQDTARGVEHHHGRDAALVGGGIAAAGLGGSALDHHARDGRAAHDSAFQGSHFGQTPTSSQTATAQTAPTTVAAGAPSQQSEADESHKGRDAAAIGGTAVAGGVAAHEINKKEQEKLERERTKEAERQQKDAERQQREAQKQQEKEAAKAEKERQKEVERQEKEAKKHAEKEAAATAAAAEAEKKKQEKEAAKAEKERQKEVERQEKEAKKRAEKEAAATAAAAEAEKKRQEEIKRKEDVRLQKEQEAQEVEAKKGHEKELAAAAVAAEAEKKHHEDGNKKAELEQQKTLEKEQSATSEQEEKGKRRRSLFGFLHRDKDKEDKRSSSADRIAEEGNKSGKLQKKEGAAAVGAVGAGAAAYGLDKDHKNRDAIRDADIGNTAGGTQNTAVPSGVGATGTSANPLTQRDATVADQPTGAGTTIGQDPTASTTNDPFQKDEHSKTPYVVGAAGATALGGAAYEHHKHEGDQTAGLPAATGATAASGPATGQTGSAGAEGLTGQSSTAAGGISGQPTTGATTEPIQEHEHGKAPYVAGAAGATALGGAAYEHHKHAENKALQAGGISQPASQLGVGSASGPTTTGSDVNEPQQKQDHGKAPYVAGAAGAAAVGGAAYEHHKHEENKGLQASTAQSTGQTGAGITGGPTTTGRDVNDPQQKQEHGKAPYVAGAAGAAAVGGAAYEHHKKEEQGAPEEVEEKSRKRRSFLGFLRRDKSKNRDDRDKSSSRSRERRDKQPAAVAEEPTASTDKRNIATTDYANKDGMTSTPLSERTDTAGLTAKNGEGNTEGVGRHHSKLHKEPPPKIREELEQKAEEIRRQSYEEHGGRHMGTDGEIGGQPENV